MVRWVLCWVVGLCLVLAVCGCGKSKPDPRKQPGFKDTTDPSKVMALPDDPSKMTQGETPK